jgi:hypothetical protein
LTDALTDCKDVADHIGLKPKELLDLMLTACKNTDINPEDNDDVPVDIFGALMLFVAFHNKDSTSVDKVLDTFINKDLFRMHTRILDLCCEVDVTESMLDAVACFGMILYGRLSSAGPGSDTFVTNPAPSDFLKPLWVPIYQEFKSNRSLWLLSQLYVIQTTFGHIYTCFSNYSSTNVRRLNNYYSSFLHSIILHTVISKSPLSEL